MLAADRVGNHCKLPLSRGDDALKLSGYYFGPHHFALVSRVASALSGVDSSLDGVACAVTAELNLLAKVSITPMSFRHRVHSTCNTMLERTGL